MYRLLSLAVLLTGLAWVKNTPLFAAAGDPKNSPSYPICSLATGVCRPEFPTPNQCTALNAGKAPEPWDPHLPVDPLDVLRVQALLNFHTCYGRDSMPLLLLESDVDPEERTYWKMNSRIDFANGGSFYHINMETTPATRKKLAMVIRQTTDANGRTIQFIDGNEPPVYVPIDETIMSKHFGEVVKKGLRGYFDPIRLGADFSLKVMNIGKGIDPARAPDATIGASYKFNQDASLAFSWFVQNCDGFSGCSRKPDHSVGMNFDATKAATKFIDGFGFLLNRTANAINPISLFTSAVTKAAPVSVTDIKSALPGLSGSGLP